MSEWWEEFKVRVPEGHAGSWVVERFTVDENLDRQWKHVSTGRFVPPGEYTRLLTVGATNPMMSDTPAEIMEHLEPMRRATGRVLINGLGLGMVLQAVLRKPDVTAVTVVEREPDVVALVAPTYAGDPRLTIVTADALTVQLPPGPKWDVVWHDIWPRIVPENWPQMQALARKYRGRARWQGFWGREWLSGNSREHAALTREREQILRDGPVTSLRY